MNAETLFRVVVVLVALGSSCGGPTSQGSCRTTCAGCCDATGQCLSGSTREACGVSGQACAACQAEQSCSVGACIGRVGQGGGPGAMGGGFGGGVAGGRVGGGAAGGQAGGWAGGQAGGAAMSTGSRCAGTTIECGAACVDPATDESHCGRCGNQCGAGLVCNAGRCEALPMDCLARPCPGDFGCDPETRTCSRRCFSAADCQAGGSSCRAGVCGCSLGGSVCGSVCSPTGTSCVCPAGSEGHPTLGCVDIDECARGTQRCGANEVCRNQNPGATCECAPGFISVRGACVADLCATNNGGCHPRASCFMWEPTRAECQCPSGLVGDGRSCVPECISSGTCADPSLACYPSPLSFYGVCERPGFGAPGDACATNADCGSGTRCERRAGGNLSFCARLCGGTTCGAGESCVTSNGAPVCLKVNSQACDLLKQDCAGGCFYPMGGPVCAPPGYRLAGSSCTYANECAVGHVCLGPANSTTYTCLKLCDPAAPQCPTGRCLALGSVPGVGVCE